MLSFHNDIKVKEKYLKRVIAHQKADEIIKGTGYENGRGCAVGCTLNAYKHENYRIELGLPVWLAYLEDKIFEGLPIQLAEKWPKQFLQAIKIGISEKQFERLLHDLAIIRQKRNLALQEKQYKLTPVPYLKQVIESIKLVIKYHKNPIESARLSVWSAASAWLAASAESAAWSARSMAWSARSVAWSVAESAESVAESAESVIESTESKSYIQESKDLLYLLKQLKPE